MSARGWRGRTWKIPGGRLSQHPRELTVRTLGRMAAVPDFNELIVANFGGQPVFLNTSPGSRMRSRNRVPCPPPTGSPA